MKVLVFGATGMVGHGVLLEALDCPVVAHILSIGRRKTDVEHPKLQQLVHTNFEDFEAIASELKDLDACMWCLGVTSAGLDEAAYTRITCDYTLAAAKVLLDQSPDARFCFVSGAGADSSERGRIMWARVKGRTENALMRMGFREVVVFRPSFIQPMWGARSRVALYRILYAIFGIFYPVFRRLGQATSTVDMGKAMIAAAMGMSEKQVLDTKDINQLAARLPSQS